MMDIGTGESLPRPMAGPLFPSENFSFILVTRTILSPNYGSLSPRGNTVSVGIQLLDLSNNTISTNDSVAIASTRSQCQTHRQWIPARASVCLHADSVRKQRGAQSSSGCYNFCSSYLAKPHRGRVAQLA